MTIKRLDTIYRRVDAELKKPEVVRAIKKTGIWFLLLNFMIFSLFAFISLRPSDVSAASLAYVGYAEGSGNSAAFNVSLTSLTGGTGGAAQAGDLVIVATGWGANSNTDGNPGVGTSGYTELFDLRANDTYDANFSVSWKLMGSTPDTTVSINGSGNTTWGTTAEVYVWRNVDSSTPFDVASVQATGANAAIPNGGSITPTTSGSVVVVAGLGAMAAADTAITVPSGYTNGADISVDPGTASTLGVASKAWSGSGAEDPAAWTNWTTTGSDSWAAVTMALRPKYTLTVGTTGSQTATIYSGTTDNYIGAFTMVMDGLSANVSQIVASITGTASTYVSNIDVYYETAGSCTFNGTETLYDTVSGLSGGNVLASGSMAVSTSQVCVYFALDVSDAAPDGSTMELYISDPSSRVLTSFGYVAPNTSVAVSGTTTVTKSQVTVGTTGTQTTTMAVSSTDQYVGGAFTLVRNNGSADVTQIIVSDTSTISADANLSNLDLYYETAGTCTYDGTETLFGTATAFSSEAATVTGTMAVGTSQVCLYAVVDVGSGAAGGETIEIQITNPSTQVTVSGGVVAPATAVAISGTTTIAGATADISGTVYTNEAKSTNIGANKTVHLFVNSADKGTDETDTSGAYLFSGVTGISANDSIIIYLDDETENGSTVTVAVNGSTNIATLDIITAHISLEHRTAGPITNADLDDIDGVDATDEDGITVSAPNVTFADNLTTYILSGETYTPGGTVTCDDFGVVGTASFNSGGNLVTVSGNWNYLTTASLDNTDLYFDGTTSQIFYTGNKTSYRTITFNNTGADGGTDDIYIGQNLFVDDLNLTNGHLILNFYDPNITIRSDLQIGSSAFITKSASGTWTFATGVAGVSNWSDATAAKLDVGIVTMSGNVTLQLGSSVKCTNITVPVSHGLNLSSNTLTLTGNSVPFTIGGTFTPSTGTIEYAPSATTGVTVESVIYHHVIFNKASNIFSLEAGGITTDVGGNMILTAGTLNANSQNQNLGGNLTLESGTTFTKGGTMTFQGTSQVITDNNSSKQDLGVVIIGPATTTSVSTGSAVTLTSLEVWTDDTLDISNDTLTITGVGVPLAIYAGANFIVTGSTVAYVGTSATEIYHADYYNLNIGGPDTTATYTIGSNGIGVYGVLTVVASSGTNTLNGSADWITFHGSGTPFIISPTEVFTASTGAVAYYGSPSANVTGTTYHDLIIGSTTTTATYTASGDLSADWIGIIQSSGTNTFDAADKIITLSGTGTPLFISTSEIFNPSTSTVVYTGTGATTYISGTQFYNLSMSPATAATYTLSWHLVTGNEVLGSINIGANATLDTVSGSNYDIEVAGNWTNDGNFTANSGTVTLNGGAGSTQTIIGDTTFYNLYATTASARTINFASGSTTTVIGTWTATGSTGQHIILGRDGGSGTDRWNINPATWNVNYVTPANSNNQAGSQINPTNYTDGGNNVNWFQTNQAPNSPTSLVQKKVTGGTTLNVGDWTNETQVQFTVTASDPDSSDTLYLCVEKDFIATALSGANGGDLCGTGVVYSGTPVTLTVTITGLTDASEYHWQAQVKDLASAYSGFVGYGGNTENPPTNPAARDFGVDTTAPSSLTVYDGDILGVQQLSSSSSLNSLKANWTAANFNVSGPATPNKYQYAIGTTPGGTEILGWTSTNTDGSVVTATGLTVNTGVMYYWTVKATDLAGNVSTVTSGGQQVLASLSFSMDTNSIVFSNLGNGNNWTDSKAITFTTKTNASNGYTIQSHILQLLTNIITPADTIANWSGPWAAPTAWAGNCTANSQCGFGYTSNDTSVQGSDRFAGGSNYAFYSLTSPGNVVADNVGPTIDGARNLVDEVFTITNKVSVLANQTAGVYQTTLQVVVTANY